jgi:uncharacterized protein YukE
MFTTKYDPNELIEAPDWIVKKSQEITEDINDLITTANSNCAEWQNSQAKAAYEQYRDGWTTDMNQMNSILVNKAAPALRNIQENYMYTEQSNAKMWNA